MKNRIIEFFVILLVGLFIVLKYPCLQVPLFWDELGVYGKGIFKMIENGISLHPNALDSNISRGHPLMYSFITAGVSNIFGASLFGIRASSLLLSILLLLSVYFIVNVVSENKLTGLVALLLVYVQAIFFAQSTLVLPEILLSLSILWALYSYSMSHYFLYCVTSSIAVLTKEPALLLLPAIGIYELTKFREFKDLKSVVNSLKFLFPLLPFSLFLMIQKQHFGWYFFPYHTDIFDFSMNHILTNLNDFVSFIFIAQGRILMTLLFGVLIVYLKYSNKARQKSSSHHFIKLSILFGVCYLIFHSTNFYMNRYLLPVIILFCVLFALYSNKIIERLNSKWAILSIGILAMVLLYLPTRYYYPKLNPGDFNHGEDMSYLHHTQSSQAVINYLVENKITENIVLSFPLILAVENPKFGYLQSDQLFNAQLLPDEHTLFYVKQNPPFINPPGMDSYSLRLIQKWSHQNVTSQLYSLEKIN